MNAQRIKQHQIKTLYGTIYTKLPGEMILKTEGFIQFQFDSIGQTTSMRSYRPHLGFQDTIRYFYQYSNKQLVATKSVTKKGYTSQRYTYLKDKLINSEERIGLNSNGEEIQTNSLNYVDQNLENYMLTTVAYEGGHTFKHLLKSYDTTRTLLKEVSIDFLQQDTITTWYTYNEDSNLIHQKTIADQTVNEVHISYQSNGEVEAITYYTNGVLSKEIQVIYQAGNQPLSSVIQLDHRTKAMEIIRF
ncbi:MAG: hypothetical protein ACKO4Y_09080 [Flavobacteriales bacterium]